MSARAILVADAAPARFELAVQLAMADAALGAAGWLYLHDGAVALASDPLIGEALATGVRVIVCQSGLAAAGLHFADLPIGVEAGGLVSLLAALGDDRLVVV